MINSFSIDTNCLITLFQDEGKLEKFIELAKEFKHEIFIPSLATDEIFATEDRQVLLRNGTKLHYIYTSLGLQLNFSSPWQHCLKKEYFKKIHRQPTISALTRKDLFSRLELFPKATVEQIQPADFSRLIRHKRSLFEADKKLRTDTENKILNTNQEDLLNFMTNYTGPTVDFFWVQMVEEHFKISTKLLIRCRKTCSYTLCAMNHYYMLGLGVQAQTKRQNPGNPVLQNLKADRGSHHDNFLATESSLCDFLITDDQNLGARVNRLNELGHVKFKAITLGDYLR